MSESVPSKIGRYVISRLLGSGAMGNVYLARDPELERQVAIKTVKSDSLDGAARELFLGRFRNEARAAARLQHPGIVAVYDVGEDAGAGPYLVFEYVPGASLKQILRSRGALPPETVCRIADDVAGALDAAHAEGIIHRDIKPDNLLVTEDERTKLADFGIARVPNAQLTREGQFLGTPCYAAPETLGEAKYGRESDLFSFGAVLYEMVSGARAFPGDDAVAVAHKVIHEEPQPPSRAAVTAKVPAEVDAVVLSALAKAPGARPKSARVLAQSLREAYLHAGVEIASSSSTTEVAGNGGASRRPRAGGAAYGAVLIGSLLVGTAVVLAFRNDGGTNGAGVDDAGVPQAPVITAVSGEDAGATHTVVTSHGGDDEPDAALVARVAPGDEPEDAGTPTEVASPAPNNGFEREEAAKEALARVRAALAANDFDTARRELEAARQLDPDNSDIDELARRLP